jgi:hypothetical protein
MIESCTTCEAMTGRVNEVGQSECLLCNSRRIRRLQEERDIAIRRAEKAETSEAEFRVALEWYANEPVVGSIARAALGNEQNGK